MTIFRRHSLLLLIAAALLSAAPAGAQWRNPKADKPPRAKPQRRSGGESLPPLPLPATPLRRTERKRPPAPPALVGMINFDDILGGGDGPTGAFPTTQIDIERLIQVANKQLGIHYRYVPTTLSTFSWDPTELPLLYVTGWTPMPQLSDALLERLRRYLYDGGTLVVHAQCGRKEFVDSARRQIARLLPDRPLKPVDTDSPLFSAVTRIKKMRFRKDDEPFKAIPPYLEAIYLGCRPAVILSPIDLNCGWDVVKHPIEGGTLYHQADATRLGVNLVAVTLANFEYARAWGVKKRYHQQDDASRDRLVIGQIIHDGDWDPTPHAAVNLLKYVQANTTLSVQFKRDIVDLSTRKVFEYPVLTITGLRDFKLSDDQVVVLRNYLKAGGVLIADAAAGRKAFDAAFRREIARALPEAKLKPLPLDSPVYQMPFTIQRVGYSKIVRAQQPDLNIPYLEGITVDGQLAVIYAPISLTTGWERLGYPFARSYSDPDAARLGANILTYALTH
ncbi:MAG: DUF4159 domain-containing protein [Planctomycetota bacterium]|jgi:hypothetical protein